MLETISNLPNPIELFLEPISLTVLAIYGGLMLWEVLSPARESLKANFWKRRRMLAFVAFFLLASYLPLICKGFLAPFQLMDLNSLGTFGGAAAGLLVFELGSYFAHRIMHWNKKLWRIFHQMHHNAERLDSYSAYCLSPADMLGCTLMGSLCLVVIAGLTPGAASLVIMSTTFFSIFQHCNIKTPVWLGYFIQRPESHALHHEKEEHHFNFSNLGFVDLFFGTFKTPEKFVPEPKKIKEISHEPLNLKRQNEAAPVLE